MDWQELLLDLYQKISPVGGRLTHRITNDFIYDKKIKHIWVEFELNHFKYFDPFYGEIESSFNFQMFISFNFTTIDSVYDLENRVIKENGFIGSFSNSLSFAVPSCEFGAINTNGTIPFKMNYNLTNSDSYGCMSGTFEDHSTFTGYLETNLKIRDLLISVHKKNESLASILKQLNPNFYLINKYSDAKNLEWVSENYNDYAIPINYNI